MRQEQNAASSTSNPSVVAGFQFDYTGRLAAREVSWPEAVTAALRRHILRNCCDGDVDEFRRQLNNTISSPEFRALLLDPTLAARLFRDAGYRFDYRLTREEAAFVANIPGESLASWNAPGFYFGEGNIPQGLHRFPDFDKEAAEMVLKYEFGLVLEDQEKEEEEIPDEEPLAVPQRPELVIYSGQMNLEEEEKDKEKDKKKEKEKRKKKEEEKKKKKEEDRKRREEERRRLEEERRLEEAISRHVIFNHGLDDNRVPDTRENIHGMGPGVCTQYFALVGGNFYINYRGSPLKVPEHTIPADIVGLLRKYEKRRQDSRSAFEIFADNLKAKDADQNQKCPICLSGPAEREFGDWLKPLPCGHAFCRGCIVALMKRGEKICPLCKVEFIGLADYYEFNDFSAKVKKEDEEFFLNKKREREEAEKKKDKKEESKEKDKNEEIRAKYDEYGQIKKEYAGEGYPDTLNKALGLDEDEDEDEEIKKLKKQLEEARKAKKEKKEKERKEQEEKERLKREKEARKYYKKEQEFLRHQANTSFGKMVLGTLKTNPQYSIGKAQRSPMYEIIKTPGPIYKHDNLSNLKYDKPPSWKIGDSQRSPLYSCEIYNYYKYPYDESSDISKIPKKWDHIKGGAPTLDPRIRYDFSEKVPGPGRYEPNYRSKSQVMKAPTYVLGVKGNANSLDLKTGTGKNVAPWTYDQSKVLALSQHPRFAKYSFQKAERKGPEQKVWTKNESYFIYSSFGNQIMTMKNTEPIQSMAKATRDGRLKCGVFKSMMERQPKSIRIQLPKF